MTHREKRIAFTRALADLIQFAFDRGYEVAIDEATEHLTAKDPTSDHSVNSRHHLGLACDLNLYRDGQYLSRTEDHAELGAEWERIGRERGLPLVWGGQFNDGNHYELEP